VSVKLLNSINLRTMTSKFDSVCNLDMGPNNAVARNIN
jgi:hypothetical protein